MRQVVAERQLDQMPFDKLFYVDDNRQELCHATGIEVQFAGDDTWWNEYQDKDGDYWYGR